MVQIQTVIFHQYILLAWGPSGLVTQQVQLAGQGPVEKKLCCVCQFPLQPPFFFFPPLPSLTALELNSILLTPCKHTQKPKYAHIWVFKNPNYPFSNQNIFFYKRNGNIFIKRGHWLFSVRALSAWALGLLISISTFMCEKWSYWRMPYFAKCTKREYADSSAAFSVPMAKMSHCLYRRYTYTCV